MKTPVVTIKVSPSELRTIDDALRLMCIVSGAVARSYDQGGYDASAAVRSVGNDIVSFVLGVIRQTAEDDPRRIPRRVSKLRESIGLV